MENRPPCSRARRRSAPLGAQRGQALIEFTIAAAMLLVPLFFMIAYVAKYHDMQSASIQAARYAAWERTVYFGGASWECSYDSESYRAKNQPGGVNWACGTAWKSDAAIQSEVGRRFFADAGEGLDGDANAPKPMWHDHAGVPLLATYGQEISTAQTPGGANKVLGFVWNDVLGKISEFIGGATFKLHMDSLYTAGVSFNPSNTSAMSRVFGVGEVLPPLNEKNVLVANGWSTNGKDFVAEKIQMFSPANVVNKPTFNTVWDTGTWLLSYAFPEFGKLKGFFMAGLKPEHADSVPGDRVSGGITPPPVRIQHPVTPKPPPADSLPGQGGRNPLGDAIAAFNGQANDIQAKINSCGADKKAEMVSNYYYPIDVTQCTYYDTEYKVHDRDWLGRGSGNCNNYQGTSYDSTVYVGSWPDYFCYVYTGDGDWTYHVTRKPSCYTTQEERVRPRPPQGYTPNFDLDYSCHGGLDARISALMPSINNQQAVIATRAACARGQATPESCAEFERKIAELQARSNNLQGQRPGLDPQWNTCGCQAGNGTNCRGTASSYSCW